MSIIQSVALLGASREASADLGKPIDQSLRFRGTQYLNRSVSSGYQANKTLSFWMKAPAEVNGDVYLVAFNNYGVGFGFGSSNSDLTMVTTSGNSPGIILRDPSAWYHVFCTNNKVYVNGVNVGSLYTYARLDASTGNLSIGCFNNGTSSFWTGYIAEMYFVDGQNLNHTDFGRFNNDGVWVPIAPSISSFGTNGFYLKFDPNGKQGQSGIGASIGADHSPNNNHFSPTGFDTTSGDADYDVMDDTPTQNFATINPLYPGASTSNGNLTTANTTGKPTILGLSGNIHDDGSSAAWNGTEAGWTFTGDIDFGQRTAADKFSTKQMPEPTIKSGSDHFRALTGTGANILAIAQGTNTNGTNWNPDVDTGFTSGLWWIKDRVNTNQHQLVDSVNGTSNVFQSPAGTTGNTYAAPSGDSVAWCWNAANTNGGFSITNGTHGLGVTPAMVIDRAGNVFHESLTAGQGLVLTSSAAAASQTWTVNSTTVSGPGSGTYYAWSEIPGHSAFGSYTGNSNADGPVINLGFKPAFILIKSQATANWMIFDSTRSPTNPNNAAIYANQITAEYSGTGFPVDFLSNGFKVRVNDAALNQNDLIYAAWAENPFGGVKTPPATAR